MNWIKKRREELNLTQEELAQRLQLAGLDITRAAVSHWETERDKAPVRDSMARQAIAKALEMTTADVLRDAGEVEVDDEIVLSLTELARRAALIVNRLPAEGQRAAIEQLRALERLFS